MMSENYDDIEKRLKSIILKPAPPGLRDRILDTASKRQEAVAWTTPLLRKCLAGCAVLLALVFFTDLFLSRAQQNRLRALIDGSRQVQSPVDDESRWLAEVLEDPIGPNRLVQKEMAIVRQKNAAQVRREDILMQLLKEDFGDNETTKNLH
jgi:hypothetical protein